MTIESKHVQLTASPEQVFNYVSDLNNFIYLLPKDKITDWTGSKNECSFKVSGVATIDLHLTKATPHSGMLLTSGEKSPFPFTMEVFINETPTGAEAYKIIKADVNPFIKMVAEGPLTNLFNYIADRLVEVTSQS